MIKKCLNCNGFGFVKILNEADEIIEMQCCYCQGSGSIDTRKLDPVIDPHSAAYGDV